MRRHLPLMVKAEAMALLAAGRTSRQVAAALLIDKATVNRWRGVVRHGVPSSEPAAGPCSHRRFEAQRGTYTCRDCGSAIHSESSLSEAPPPTWAREVVDHERPPVVVHQPVWRT